MINSPYYIKEKYGVDNVFQSDEIKQKIRKTNKEKYGNECASKTNIVKDKIKQTCLEKYGVEAALASDIIRKKIEETNIDRYGSKVACPFGSDKFQNIIQEKYVLDNVSKLHSIK